jgi:hypothetical protein
LTNDEGQHFIAMEYLDGMTLKHRIGGRPMETEIIIGFAIEIAQGTPCLRVLTDFGLFVLPKNCKIGLVRSWKYLDVSEL